jgi:uncharacterized alkaline shock family protein YloU
MKYLDRLINFIFSLAILLVSIVVIMISAGFIGYESVDAWIKTTLFSTANNTVTCIVSIVVFLAALKTTIFLSRTNGKKKSAILVDTNHGKVQIAQETIENTAKGATKKYEEIKDVQVRMLKEKRGINVYMALMVMPNTNVIELSASVQDAVKEAIEDTTGVKVNNVDIKIKNISEGRQNKPKVKEEAPKKEENVVEEQNVVIPQENIEENATVENQEESNEQEIKEE